MKILIIKGCRSRVLQCTQKSIKYSKNTTVVMSPTVKHAVYKWKEFISRWSTMIKKVSRPNLYVELLTGHKIYFKSETQGQRALLGLHADIISEDEFVISKEMISNE